MCTVGQSLGELLYNDIISAHSVQFLSRYTYGNVKVLKTFDTAGAIAYHVGRVKEIQIPYFTGPGQY